MAMRRETGIQDDLVATWAEMPRSPGHAFYDRLQALLKEAGFDAFVEDLCKPYYAPRMGAPSLPPGRYFRMHMVGYFEGIDSERGICWRCSDSLSLREFLRLASRDKVADHSWLSKTRSRLPHEVHEKVFGWVLSLVAERGLVKGERIGVDGSTMEANAALRTIVRRDSGETYRQMLTQMAKESGVETPTIDDLVRLDRKRKGKKLSNKDWTSPTDPDAKIARMKDGTTHLAYKPEHAVDLDTGVIVAAPIHAADEGDTTTLPGTLEAAARNLAEVGLAPTQAEPCVLVGDKGYHSREGLKDLDGGVWKTRISEPEPANGYLRWHGDEAARQAVYANRARLKSGVGRNAMRKRSEMVERSFAHVLDRGGMRRAWLRGRENVHKRYLIHVAGFNLGILMRALFGSGTPREAASAKSAILFVIQFDAALAKGHRGEHRRQTSNTRHHRRTRNGLIRKRLHHPPGLLRARAPVPYPTRTSRASRWLFAAKVFTTAGLMFANSGEHASRIACTLGNPCYCATPWARPALSWTPPATRSSRRTQAAGAGCARGTMRQRPRSWRWPKGRGATETAGLSAAGAMRAW